MKRILILFIALASLMAISLTGVAAQDDDTPMIAVSDQLSLDGTVTVDAAYSEGPGFVVIHIDNDGGPGPVAGYAALPDGLSTNITVNIDTTMATPVLYAMLHADTGEVGVYEFGTVEGADGPVRVNDQVVTPPFNATIVDANDQFASNGTVTVKSVVSAENGWLVIHSDGDGGPGPVLGASLVEAGQNTDVVVELESDATGVVWPMLHTDTGEAGVYEFGEVEGADSPVVVDGQVATFPIWTVPHMRVADQVVVHGDNYPGDMMGMEPTVTAASVLSEGAGWLVIHSDGDGSPGPVLGAAPVEDGLNENVTVTLEGDLTPVVWPMLHTDTGEAGVYEFGTVEGADSPVRVNDQVLTFPINAAPSLDLPESAAVVDGVLTIDGALIDSPGWLAIHSSSDGSPGPVIGQARLLSGFNANVAVQVDAEAAGSQVFPMLHYDTGESGVYEFGTVEGADSPVRVNDSVVVAPLTIGE